MLRSLSGVTVLYLLAVLLAGTSPVGTGQGVHRDQLVDLLVPHVHFGSGGAAVPAGSPQPMARDTPSSPSVGAGAGADGASSALALTPPLPAVGQIVVPSGGGTLGCLEALPPRGYDEAPPDPPPTGSA